MYLRVNTLNKLVPYAAQRFIDNLPAIFAGTFNHALLEDASECSDLLKLYKNVAVKHVFGAIQMSSSLNCRAIGSLADY